MRPDRPEPLAAKVAAALDRLARARRIHRQEFATRHKLTPLQGELLATLAQGTPPPPLVGLLATEVGVTQPTATDSLRALEHKGLVERHHDTSDARRAPYQLTKAGRLLAGELAGVDLDLLGAIESLPVPIQAATLETLLTLIARLVTTGTISVTRTCLTCRHHHHDGTTHRCTLLDANLTPAELRVNCPEHQPAHLDHDRERFENRRHLS